MTPIKAIASGIGALALAAAAYIAYAAHETRAHIGGFEQALMQSAQSTAPAAPGAEQITALPAPVQRYIAFAFPAGIPAIPRWITLAQEGRFRRPLTESFAHTDVRQIIATARPDLVFSADTPLLGPIWAIAYDSYIGGEMEMEARLLSAISVMHELSTPTLDQISLRRWLLESSANPFALLPGGLVQWEAVSDTQARAHVSAHGYNASLLATFDESGALTSFAAEEDGDLSTPYHGSGEHVTRGAYELVEGVRFPMEFSISRMAGGTLYPFWSGRVTSLTFEGV